MNNVLLVGRLAKDPIKKATQSGVSVTYITIAVNRNYKNKEGNYDTDFINCVLYRSMADNTAVYCHKGDLVSVRGAIQTRSYHTQDGSTRYITEVSCKKIVFLQTKKVEDKEATRVKEETTSDPYADFGEEVELDPADLPFDFSD